MRMCFFFKQKTAYEMRISDWSSDVCSSDLHDGYLCDRRKGSGALVCGVARGRRSSGHSSCNACRTGKTAGTKHPHAEEEVGSDVELGGKGGRSEEHTSELQSLMRISYAVFCLKKKTTTTTTIHRIHLRKTAK